MPALRRNARQEDESSQIGRSLHALRAYVKALSFRNDSGNYTYKISEDKTRAAVLDSDGNVIADQSIQQWAKEGAAIRLAFIGLKYAKEMVDNSLHPKRALYHLNTLNSISQQAFVEIESAELLTCAQLKNAIKASYTSASLADQDTVLLLLSTLTDSDLITIAGWSKLGRAVEVQIFEGLQAAEQCASPEVALKERQRAYALGVIRKRQSN